MTLGFNAYCDESMDVQKMYEESQKEAYEMMSKGMTPAQKVQLKKQMQKQAKQMMEYSKMSPEEQKKLIQTKRSEMNSAESKAQIKKQLENMTPEQKEMLKRAMKNFK